MKYIMKYYVIIHYEYDFVKLGRKDQKPKLKLQDTAEVATNQQVLSSLFDGAVFVLFCLIFIPCLLL